MELAALGLLALLRTTHAPGSQPLSMPLVQVWLVPFIALLYAVCGTRLGGLLSGLLVLAPPLLLLLTRGTSATGWVDSRTGGVALGAMTCIIHAAMRFMERHLFASGRGPRQIPRRDGVTDVLRAFAKRLRRNVSGMGGLVDRWGGEEFLVLLPVSPTRTRRRGHGRGETLRARRGALSGCGPLASCAWAR